MTLERFDGISGTAWIITARWRQQRRQGDLVPADEPDEHCFHGRSPIGLSAGQRGSDRPHVEAQPVEGERVCVGACANGQIDRWLSSQCWQQFRPHQLAQATLEPVAIHGRLMMTRDDDGDTRMSERGSDYPDIEVPGPDSLPLSNDSLNLGASRQPARTRKPESVVRRRRTCPGAGRSGDDVLSCAGD